MSPRTRYVWALGAGFIYALWMSIILGGSIVQAAWFFWSASLVSLPLSSALYLAEYFLKVFPSMRQRKMGIAKMNGELLFSSPFVYTCFLLAITLVSAGITLFLGLFLSIIAPMDPQTVYGIEGYSRHFSIKTVIGAFMKGVVFLPVFLCFKTSAIVVTPSQRLRGHGFSSAAGLALAACFIASFTGRALNGPIPQHQQDLLSILIFWALVLLPWPLLVGKDLRTKRFEGIPELQVPIKVPVEYVYRVDQPFWGGVLCFAGVCLIGLVLKPLALIAMMPTYSIMAKGIIIGVIMAVGSLVSGAFILAGMNMILGRRKIVITQSAVACEDQDFMLVRRSRTFKEPLSSYVSIMELENIWPATGDSTSTSQYTVVLKHRNDPAKDICLYAAYHDEAVPEVARQWAQLLRLGLKPAIQQA